MKNIYFIIIYFCTFSLFAQVDNYAKNKKQLEEINAIYEKELKEKPNSYEPYLNHANRLAKLKSNASNTAVEYYIKAMDLDSTNNREIYKGLGDFCLEKKDLELASMVYNAGLRFTPNDSYFIQKIEEIEEKEKENQLFRDLHSMPVYDEKKITVDMSFEERTNYNVLFKEVKKGKYSYEKLSSTFKVNPEKLSPKEMFYLTIGFTQQDNFKPYNLNDENKLRELTSDGKIDEALDFGTKVISKEPLNIIILNELLYCYRVNKDEINIKFTEQKLTKILEGILYSGNGTCEDPYLTICPKEEYYFGFYLNYKTMKVVNTQKMCGELFTDEMLAKDKNGNENYIYFNYTPIFKTLVKN
ncbi:DUF4919 domain-containing protein [Aureivirga sp. CE67]|uniref:DUF4919 domain-containing protein n=1 Tax=Aureivirga sp. CE67 TaxID=1788983 RepID=UPI0018C9ACE5|nr:DUF4919 domain-containing protein [Aureivirga sp. CE67]